MTQSSRAAGPGITVPQAAALLAHLGFEIVHGDRPGEAGGANLLVGLRATPTLEHFDPERVTYWVAKGGRGRLAELSLESEVPFDGSFSWGTLRVIDRLEEMNAFLTFGGQLHVAVHDPGLTIAVFSSSGPIVRWSGHSQPIDSLTGYVGAFFARLMIPIDFRPGAEAQVAATSPAVLYAAFLADLQARLHAEREAGAISGDLEHWVERETTRIGAATPGAHEGALGLLAGLGLEPGA
jgi:hypothetical protein